MRVPTDAGAPAPPHRRGRDLRDDRRGRGRHRAPDRDGIRARPARDSAARGRRRGRGRHADGRRVGAGGRRGVGLPQAAARGRAAGRRRTAARLRPAAEPRAERPPARIPALDPRDRLALRRRRRSTSRGSRCAGCCPTRPPRASPRRAAASRRPRQGPARAGNRWSCCVRDPAGPLPRARIARRPACSPPTRISTAVTGPGARSSTRRSTGDRTGAYVAPVGRGRRAARVALRRAGVDARADRPPGRRCRRAASRSSRSRPPARTTPGCWAAPAPTSGAGIVLFKRSSTTATGPRCRSAAPRFGDRATPALGITAVEPLDGARAAADRDADGVWIDGAVTVTGVGGSSTSRSSTTQARHA